MRSFILAVCAFFAILVIALIVAAALKHRRENPGGSLTLEFGWTFIPFVLAIAIFGWSAAMLFN